MSIETWRSLLTVAADLHHQAVAALAPDSFITRFVWHGGEPLLLPRQYFAEVLDMQRQIFGSAAPKLDAVENSLQTNLYKPDFSLVQQLHAAGFTFGVSHDYAPGLRLAANGKDSSQNVERHLKKLDDLGIKSGTITVITNKNVDALPAIYRQARDAGRRMRFLPYAVGNGSDAMSLYATHPQRVVESLSAVMREWLDDGCPIMIEPLFECLRLVAMHWLGLEQISYDRNEVLDALMVVEPDGAIRTIAEQPLGDDIIGHVQAGSWSVIRSSAAYQQSVRRDRAIRSEVCAACEFRAACNGYPAIRFDMDAAQRGECRLYQPLLRNMAAQLKAIGFQPEDLRGMLLAHAA